jgi:murein DD-endopeptidase MepM/ murein hydrolase activator NlpD
MISDFNLRQGMLMIKNAISKSRLQKTLKSRTIRWAIPASLVLALCAGVLAIQVEHWIVRSRTVKQTQIAEGWKAAGLEITGHTIQQRENFWKVAREYHIDIDTIIGANQDLKNLQAALGQKIRIPNQRGVLHRVDGEDSIQTLSSLYAVSAATIMTANNLQDKNILPPGVELFIPGARPVRLTGEMSARYGLRGIFGSPLPGRITSTMGMRKHPVGGFRGRHTGVDLAAAEGTRIAAAAAGVVKDAGEGEYIGKFVILSHKDSYTTVYGHCSQTLVRKGERIKKGQVIARVGNTGRTTGPHLHFEIRKNGIPQDPLSYLW